MGSALMPNLEDLRYVKGDRLALRLVSVKDAPYIYGLRTNSAYNNHLSAVTGTIDDQKTWIKKYKEREAGLSELYYVIERLDCTPCGLVRLYDIIQESFTWGSWILDQNKPAKAALESAVLSFSIGFESLDLRRAVFDVRLGNRHAIAFYRRLGAIETARDDANIYFEYPRTRFRADQDEYQKIIRKLLNDS